MLFRLFRGSIARDGHRSGPGLLVRRHDRTGDRGDPDRPGELPLLQQRRGQRHDLAQDEPFWQRLFLTVGILIAVVGMRMVFPLLIVGVTANLNPAEAIRLALEGRSAHPGTTAI